MDETPSVAKAFEVFERARSAYVSTVEACRHADPPRVVPADLTRHLFECGALVLTCYCHDLNWPEGPLGRPLQPFPPVLAKIYADFARYLAAGKLPGPISDALRPGAPATGPEELRDQGWAVAYLLAVGEGIVADRKPTATVADAFAIDRRTIRRWKKKLVASGMSWHDMVPGTVPEAERGKFIGGRMRTAGQRYLKQGRLATPRRQ
jgi:hypothetical protein